MSRRRYTSITNLFTPGASPLNRMNLIKSDSQTSRWLIGKPACQPHDVTKTTRLVNLSSLYLLTIWLPLSLVLLIQPHSHLTEAYYQRPHRETFRVSGQEIKLSGQFPIDSYLDDTVQLNDYHTQHHYHKSALRQQQIQQFTGEKMKERQRLDQNNRQIQGGGECLRKRQSLDLCTAKLIAFGSKKPSEYPHDMNELDRVYCPEAKKLMKCISDSSSCYTRFDRQVIDWVMSSTRKMVTRSCKNESEKRRFVRMVNTCFDPMESDKSNTCMRNYIGSLDAIAQSDINLFVTGPSQDDIGIQLACCANKRFRSCMMKEAKQHCRSAEISDKFKRATPRSVSNSSSASDLKSSKSAMMQDVETTLENMSLQGPSFFCRGVTDSFCMKKFDNKFTGKSPKHKSILPSMIAIYSQKA